MNGVGRGRCRLVQRCAVGALVVVCGGSELACFVFMVGVLSISGACFLSICFGGRVVVVLVLGLDGPDLLRF